MINNKKILALVPARGGSKGLPGKNIRSFCGKPLIAWPIEMALASQYVDKIMVSTDCPKIASVAKKSGAEVCIRPNQLASDTAIVADVIRDLLARLDERFDYVFLLEATSPMRTVMMLDRCVEKIERLGADSIATFSEADPPPTRLWNIDDDFASPLFPNADPFLPRQQQQQAFHLNGLIYGFSTEAFLVGNSNSLFVGRGVAVVTDGICIDIDTLDDFELAELMVKRKNEIAN